MKRILYILVLVLLVGCRETAGSVGEGALEIASLGIEVEDTVTPIGKAPQANALVVLETTIYDETSQVVEHFAAGEMLPLTVPLRAGTYRIVSRSANRFPEDAARLDFPLYLGQKTFEITSGQVTSIELVCPEQTASARVAYSDDFQTIFPPDRYKYWVQMTSSIGASIVVEATETKAAFFHVPTPDVQLFYTVLMQQKNAEGVWVPFWGEAEGLHHVSLQVDTKNANKSIESGVVYEILVSVPNSFGGL